jgi:hypothetical protein
VIVIEYCTTEHIAYVSCVHDFASDEGEAQDNITALNVPGQRWRQERDDQCLSLRELPSPRSLATIIYRLGARVHTRLVGAFWILAVFRDVALDVLYWRGLPVLLLPR